MCRNPGWPSDVFVSLPISGELNYEAWCKGFDASGAPLGCHFGTWHRVDNVTGAAGQPPLCMARMATRA